MPRTLALTREEINSGALARFTRRVQQSVSLAHFARTFKREGKLSKSERLAIVEQAQLLLEMNFAHLPLKQARHAVDPIRKLKRLKFLIEQTKSKDLPDEIYFHHEMQKVFISTRDNHTNYSLPAPFKSKSAFLPFVIAEYFITNGTRHEPKYIVSNVAQRFLRNHLGTNADSRPFRKGVELLFWNGIPIRRAIELNAQNQPGSNHEARFARGLDSMTIRPFNVSLPPDEQWVVITYRTDSNQGSEIHDLKLQWRVYVSKPDKTALPKPIRHTKRPCSMDPQKSATNYVKWNLFPELQDTEVSESGIFRTKILTDGEENFGYIRILTFNRQDQLFVKEFMHLLQGLPSAGLIIDVRGNGGGVIEAGERTLQLLTPRRIVPESFQFLATPLNLEICRRADKDTQFDRWRSSIAQAADTGAVHSIGLPITSEELCNDIGQIYYGPVLLITDALCYSATDIFTAGFQDNEVGQILGVSSNTGAGGASVVDHKHIARWMSASQKSPYHPLPKRITMRVSLLRSLRVGKLAERPLEELGVIPDARHHITKNDLLHNNEDLIQKAIQMLKSRPRYSLSVTATRTSNGSGTVVVETENISRLDFYLNDRPHIPSYVAKKQGDTITLNNISLAGRNPKLVVEGYSRGKLVARHMTRQWKRA